MRSDEIRALVAEVVAGEGAELVDFKHAGSSHRPLFRAYVDIPGGTTLERCAELSRKIEARLDASGLAGEGYTLEVSSPGLDRPLRTRRDFERLLGRRVLVRTRAELAGHELVGVLEEVGGEAGGEPAWIILRPEGTREALRVVAEEIAFAKPFVPW